MGESPARETVLVILARTVGLRTYRELRDRSVKPSRESAPKRSASTSSATKPAMTAITIRMITLLTPTCYSGLGQVEDYLD